jgi:NADPH:quinone reductase-like Zn-dependent oxidoreductase
VAKKPASLDFIRAAAVPLAALTAWQALFDYGRQVAGERVLVHAGAGGVGSFAVQFAEDAGAHVIATGSRKNADFIRQLGADQFIDYQKQRFEDEVH